MDEVTGREVQDESIQHILPPQQKPSARRTRDSQGTPLYRKELELRSFNSSVEVDKDCS